ncbi:Urea-proton symporter DUR3, partial [Lamellibrachia satsuma]
VFFFQDNIDTDFDAGGKVSVGLTATTIVSQWIWAATLLQSSAVGSKYGISGPFWYAAGATIQILLFAMLSVQLKVQAPGAKTFLQVIRARFGRRTHLVFCGFALMTNLIVTAMLMLGGAAVMTNLVKGLSVELATILVATIIGTYTFIGGLGATFYVSYFNTSIIYITMLVFLVKVYHDPDNVDNPIGSIEKMYEFVSCARGPSSNEGGSFLTMNSDSGLIFGIINVVGKSI